MPMMNSNAIEVTTDWSVLSRTVNSRAATCVMICYDITYTDPIEREKYSLVEISVVSSRVNISLVKSGYTSAAPYNTDITTVQILGLRRRVSDVVIDDQTSGFTYQHTGNVR